MQYESEHVEYKSQMTDDIYKAVIAFANTDGGTIYIGVDDNRNVVGIDRIDETYTRLTNGIYDAIVPDVTMFIRYTLQDNNVIKIEIGEGSYKPYYLKSKGMKPNGVYVRQGASSVQASYDQIRKMIKDSDSDVFEEMRSTVQELTFTQAEAAFKKYKVEFSKEKFVALGLRNIQDDQYTNLAMIVSDQCQHTIKIAVFDDDSNIIFKDAKIFDGSIFKQLENSFYYLTLCNHTAATFKGLERLELPDYPQEALREALLNALVHRDYSYSGSIIININKTCIEFISIGGLPPGLTAEDILNGISQPRNKNLAEIFYRLRLIESYGTGLRKIYALYKNSSVQPRIEVTSNTFKLVLPNMNANIKSVDNKLLLSENPPIEITKQMQTVIDYLTEHGEMTDEDIQQLLSIKKTRAYLIVRKMNESGLIEAFGKGAFKKYKLK